MIPTPLDGIYLVTQEVQKTRRELQSLEYASLSNSQREQQQIEDWERKKSAELEIAKHNSTLIAAKAKLARETRDLRIKAGMAVPTKKSDEKMTLQRIELADTPLDEWSSNEVRDWLQQQGLSEYQYSLRNYDGLELRELTIQKVRELVGSDSETNEVWSAIRKLQNDDEKQHSYDRPSIRSGILTLIQQGFDVRGNSTVEMVRTAFEVNGVDINCDILNGYSALHTACYHGRSDIVEMLSDIGADLHLKNSSDGGTPFHSLAQYRPASSHSDVFIDDLPNYLSIATFLLSEIRTPLPFDNYYRTPLSYAVESPPHISLIRIIADSEVDLQLHVKDNSNTSIYDRIVRSEFRDDIWEALKGTTGTDSFLY